MTLVAACWHQAHAARPLAHLLPVHSQQALNSLRQWQPLSNTIAIRSCYRRKATHAAVTSEAPEVGVTTGAAVIKAQVQWRLCATDLCGDHRLTSLFGAAERCQQALETTARSSKTRISTHKATKAGTTSLDRGVLGSTGDGCIRQPGDV